MASDNKFAHISVNAGDDDVVIHAGAAAMAESDDEAASGEIEPGVVEEEPLEAAPQPDGDAVAPRAPVPQPASKGTYHETTLEDIQGSTMGITQKVVIALAIVLVIAMIIYMAFFNGQIQ